jgi:hypothetical protein
MICIPYHVSPSLIPGAGSGLFTSARVSTGRVIIAPTHIEQTVPLRALTENPDHPHADSSIRWFEDQCTISPEWPDECYVNHAFEPTGLWHLGFIFALRDLDRDEEITVDYRHLLGPEVELPFLDALTQQAIVGYSWHEKLLRSSEAMLELARIHHQRQPAQGAADIAASAQNAAAAAR